MNRSIPSRCRMWINLQHDSIKIVVPLLLDTRDKTVVLNDPMIRGGPFKKSNSPRSKIAGLRGKFIAMRFNSNKNFARNTAKFAPVCRKHRHLRKMFAGAFQNRFPISWNQHRTSLICEVYGNRIIQKYGKIQYYKLKRIDVQNIFGTRRIRKFCFV